MFNRVRLSVSLLCIAAWGVVHGLAQAPVGSLNGTCTTRRGGVMQGAAVTVTNKDTGQERQVVTARRWVVRGVAVACREVTR